MKNHRQKGRINIYVFFSKLFLVIHSRVSLLKRLHLKLSLKFNLRTVKVSRLFKIFFYIQLSTNFRYNNFSRWIQPIVDRGISTTKNQTLSIQLNDRLQKFLSKIKILLLSWCFSLFPPLAISFIIFFFRFLSVSLLLPKNVNNTIENHQIFIWICQTSRKAFVKMLSWDIKCVRNFCWLAS